VALMALSCPRVQWVISDPGAAGGGGGNGIDKEAGGGGNGIASEAGRGAAELLGAQLSGLELGVASGGGGGTEVTFSLRGLALRSVVAAVRYQLLALSPGDIQEVRRSWRPCWRTRWLRFPYVASVLVTKY
jgi:hypothetical protein